VVVEREGDITELGQLHCDVAGVLVEPRTLVGHEDTRSPLRAIRYGQGADHGAVVGVV
jgi:hypothetical protein